MTEVLRGIFGTAELGELIEWLEQRRRSQEDRTSKDHRSGSSSSLRWLKPATDTRYRIMAVKRLRLFKRPWLEPGDTMTVPIAAVNETGRSQRSREGSGMTTLIAPRRPAVIGDLRDPDVDREAVDGYYRTAGAHRARAAIAAQEGWLDRQGSDRHTEGPLGYVLVFLLTVGIVLWVIA